jgi:cytochrome b pre-mRNA-processing protein 3
VTVGVTPEDGFGKARTPGKVPDGGNPVIFGWFRKRAGRRAPADALFARIAEASRRPALYIDGGIPDSFEGRFESLALHMFLVLRRLRELPRPADGLAQDLTDACFDYLELGFRNGGVSDIAVPKRMKKIGQMFYGRLQAYGAAVSEPEPAALEEALRRNAAPSADAAVLADYLRTAQAQLAGYDLDLILKEATLFPIFCATEPLHDA